MEPVENQGEQRKRPTVSFPDGITPPIKEIDEVIVNGTKQYRYTYYPTCTHASLINFHGSNPEEWKAKPNQPLSSPREDRKRLSQDIVNNVYLQNGYIELRAYIKEQQKLIAKQNRVLSAFEALPAKPKTHWKKREKHLLYEWYMEINGRRNIPSKDWVPYTQNYDLLLPQYAHEAED